jgi:predicted nuclease with RNAse H fold
MNPGGQRFLGLELGGSRRTALVTLEYFAKEQKAFLREIESPVQLLGDDTPDETLVRVLSDPGIDCVGVDAPLTLPPALLGDEPGCPGVRGCREAAVVWMRQEAERLKWGRGKLPTPYTQRPVDLLLRGRWQDDAIVPFPVDESFGASRAPLAARMQFLQRHLPEVDFLEVVPRLSLSGIALWYGLSSREVRRARDVEEGVEQRMGILEAMNQVPRVEGLPQLFLYNADISAIAQDLSAFDAFLCAATALFGEVGLLEDHPFEESWGNVAKPRRMRAQPYLEAGR